MDVFFSNDLFLCFWAVIMDGMYSDEEPFLTQNSLLEEILQHNFSFDSVLDGLVASDEPASRNSCTEELKQVVAEESIKDGRTDRPIEFLSILFVVKYICR